MSTSRSSSLSSPSEQLPDGGVGVGGGGSVGGGSGVGVGGSVGVGVGEMVGVGGAVGIGVGGFVGVGGPVGGDVGDVVGGEVGAAVGSVAVPSVGAVPAVVVDPGRASNEVGDVGDVGEPGEPPAEPELRPWLPCAVVAAPVGPGVAPVPGLSSGRKREPRTPLNGSSMAAEASAFVGTPPAGGSLVSPWMRNVSNCGSVTAISTSPKTLPAMATAYRGLILLMR